MILYMLDYEININGFWGSLMNTGNNLSFYFIAFHVNYLIWLNDSNPTAQ